MRLLPEQVSFASLVRIVIDVPFKKRSLEAWPVSVSLLFSNLPINGIGVVQAHKSSCEYDNPESHRPPREERYLPRLKATAT
jgi:hypothetical protein